MYLDLALLISAMFGSKLLLALMVIYYLLPRERRCTVCDGETVRLTARRGFALPGRLLRVHRRFCLGCGKTLLARGERDARVWVGDARERAPERLAG